MYYTVQVNFVYVKFHKVYIYIYIFISSQRGLQKVITVTARAIMMTNIFFFMSSIIRPLVNISIKEYREILLHDFPKGIIGKLTLSA